VNDRFPKLPGNFFFFCSGASAKREQDIGETDDLTPEIFPAPFSLPDKSAGSGTASGVGKIGHARFEP
jgi:hypothetical protein